MHPLSRPLAIAPRARRAVLAPCALAALVVTGCADPRDGRTTAAFGPGEPQEDPGGGGGGLDNGAPDLAIQKRHLGSFLTGDTGVFELGVSNLGNAPVTAFIVTDVLDPAFTFVSAAAPPWSCTATAAPPQTVTCTWGGGPVPPLTSLPPLYLTVQIGEHTGPIDNCARVAIDETVDQGPHGGLDADPRNDTSCDTVTIASCSPLDHNLGTAIRDRTQSTIPAGGSDDTWRLIASPGGANLGPPRVNATYPWWLPSPQWVTPAVNASNQPVGLPDGAYVFETCFCLSSDFSNPDLALHLNADNWFSSVKLNGCELVSTLTGGPGNYLGAPLDLSVTDPTCFQPDRNCVQLTVQNTLGPIGLHVTGSITADNAGTCCPCCADC